MLPIPPLLGGYDGFSLHLRHVRLVEDACAYIPLRWHRWKTSCVGSRSRRFGTGIIVRPTVLFQNDMSTFTKPQTLELTMRRNAICGRTGHGVAVQTPTNPDFTCTENHKIRKMSKNDSRRVDGNSLKKTFSLFTQKIQDRTIWSDANLNIPMLQACPIALFLSQYMFDQT